MKRYRLSKRQLKTLGSGQKLRVAVPIATLDEIEPFDYFCQALPTGIKWLRTADEHSLLVRFKGGASGLGELVGTIVDEPGSKGVYGVVSVVVGELCDNEEERDYSMVGIEWATV